MPQRKMFPNSIVPLPASAGLTPQGMIVNAAEQQHRAERMDVSFSLSIPPAAQKELESRVDRGEVVSPEELQHKYSVAPATISELQTWLKSEGFTITEVSADHTAVYASAPVSQIEASLGVHVVRVTEDGITYNAVSDVPSLPESVGAPVVHIGGLQPYRRAHKNLRWHPHPVATRTDPEMAPAVANAPPYLVSEIITAYDGLGLNLTGAGQEIAILIDTFPTDSDLTAFWAANNVAGSLKRITKINVKGGPLPAPSGEESLDAEWTSGIAPNANIRIYASGTLAFVDLDRALDRIIADAMARPALRIVSISLGLGETYMTPAEINAEEAKFLRLAAIGVNVFVSTGDAGSNPGPDGHRSNGPLQPEWMSTSPHVVAVGGTSLKLTTAGLSASETGWAGSGGGKSGSFPRPAWQKGTGVPAGTQRCVPDISANADPNEGALVVVNGQKQQIGGTSWSTPMWAGLCAWLNESRQKSGQPPLSYLNLLLYPLIGSNCLRDIGTGANGAYHCNAGYDLVTGIGSPDIKQLVAHLGH